MNKAVTVQIGAVFLTTVLACGAVYTTVSAHESESVAHMSEHVAKNGVATVEQMEKLVALLNELVLLLNALHIQQSYESLTTIPIETEDTGEMKEHHDEHASATTNDDTEPVTAPKLVIEVEAHHDDTHVHVRYVDKQEDMFFVESDITDEAGIISDVRARTGLSDDEIRDAIKYLQ